MGSGTKRVRDFLKVLFYFINEMVDDDKNSVNNMTNARKFSLIYHYRVIIEVNRLERPGLGDPPHGAGRCSRCDPA